MKFRSYGAEIVSDVALGRQQNEPNQRVSFREFNFQTLQKTPKGGINGIQRRKLDLYPKADFLSGIQLISFRHGTSRL